MADFNGRMKWWGWGEEDVEFDIASKPELWPYVVKMLKLTSDPPLVRPIALENIDLPEQKRNTSFLERIRVKLNANQIYDDKHERLVHAFGKSFRDLWRVRRGIVEHSPDFVVYPESEDDVVVIVAAANDCNVVVIPFGGGSNIAGCLESRDPQNRMIVSLDMSRMNRVLEVDNYSQTATIQTGVFGQHMEQQLAKHGMTLGHFPDSFMHSTLGGWIATRSAGMQSDRYGKIEDMVISLRMVTPSGTIVTRKTPRASNGIDVNRVCVGSEGILGVITEATMRVHRVPAKKTYVGYLFPSFESGVDAIYECVEKDCMPVITRLNDAAKTALSAAFKAKPGGTAQLLAKGIKSYLRKVKKFELEKSCLMITAFEGTENSVRRQRKQVGQIYKKHGGFGLGESPGRSFERSKYDFPYFRDFVMDRSIVADVSETCTVWSNIVPLYNNTMSAVRHAIEETGNLPWAGCHISHSYHSGASLYFTFAFMSPGEESLQHYLAVKKAVEDAFISNGATLSHHHAVGTEHLPWMKQEISETGLKAVQALKDGLDPESIMNPGKILPSANPWEDWGLQTHQSVAQQKGE